MPTYGTYVLYYMDYAVTLTPLPVYHGQDYFRERYFNSGKIIDVGSTYGESSVLKTTSSYRLYIQLLLFCMILPVVTFI